jgi:hypothetical protein
MEVVMERTVYRYEFEPQVPFEDVEESLLLAVLAVESLHGRSALRLCTSFYLDKKRRSVVVDGDTLVGQHIAHIFTGLLTQEFGEEAFKVTRSLERKKEAGSLEQGEGDESACHEGVA